MMEKPGENFRATTDWRCAGCAQTLTQLIGAHGYFSAGWPSGNTDPQALFLGDIIDRGPRIVERCT